MKRLQIMIDEDLDAELGRRANREHTSKAALIRAYVRERLTPLPPIEQDPLWSMVGADGDAEPAKVDVVEATSFALMRERRISQALAFDGDFAAAGFVELRA